MINIKYKSKMINNIAKINIPIIIMCPNLYDDVSSKILPIIQGAKNVAQIPKNDKVPQIVLKDLSPKHSVIFKAIIAPNPAKPIPKIIIPIHIPIMFP